MKKIFLFLIFAFLVININAQSDFLTEQKKYKRVRTAIKNKESKLINKLNDFDIEINDLNIIIIAYKAENILEIFAKRESETTYQKIETYKICSKSGKPGPKRKQGDYQVPEGFYFIDRFNPASSYHLSLGINYPNQSDRIISTSSNLGGDIFIHGSCVTIGCLPMTDDKIDEIYLYAIHARNNGQNKIPVYIFPFRMDDNNFSKYSNKYRDYKGLIEFWTNIKSGYDKFCDEKMELDVVVDIVGKYNFK